MSTFVYRVFGQSVEFPEKHDHFPRSSSGPDFSFSVSDETDWNVPANGRHIFTAEEDGVELVSYFDGESSLVFRIHDVVDFTVSADTNKITAYLKHDMDRSDATSLLISHILPVLLSIKGELVLHGASLVSPSGHTAMILGDKGRGKSTHTAYALEKGFKYLSDDASICTIEEGEVLVTPSLPEIRIGSDFSSRFFNEEQIEDSIPVFSKLRVPVTSNFVSDPRSLNAILILSHKDEAEFSIVPVKGSDATSLLLAQSFKFDPFERARVLRELEQIESLLLKVPVFEVRGYREMTLISKVLDWIDNFSEEGLGWTSKEADHVRRV